MDPTRPAPSRLKQTLSAEARALLAGEHRYGDLATELRLIARIDAAHTLMLRDCGLIGAAEAAALIELQRTLVCGDGLRALADADAPRGAYVLYEAHLIECLGNEVGGMVHLGRSRNDLNATVFALQMRGLCEAVADSLLALRDTLIERAQRHATTPFVVYSQFQPALPGTFGFYLAGVEAALARQHAAMAPSWEAIGNCPLGAGGGAGTDVPIDCARTAALLGFEAPVAHALDAVASRDAAFSLLAAAVGAGTAISRIAQDLQLWTMQETGLVTLPDRLVGTSSMMPQKRNPYLLEKIKGKSARIFSALHSIVACTQKSPFSNTIESGTEAILDLRRGVADLVAAADLLRLVIADADVDAAAVARARTRGVVDATGVCNALVLAGACSFRAAHDRVGAVIRDALARGEDPDAAVRSIAPPASADPRDAAAALAYGGGPGSYGDATAFDAARLRLLRDAEALGQRRRRWNQADTALRAALGAEPGATFHTDYSSTEKTTP